MAKKNKVRKYRDLRAAEQANKCYWCHKEFTEINIPTAEHLVPRVLGGSDEYYNIVAACAFCNQTRACLGIVGWQRLMIRENLGPYKK